MIYRKGLHGSSMTTTTIYIAIIVVVIFNFILQELYVYISTIEQYKLFSKEDLVWHERGMVYGDWTHGPNGDATYMTALNISIPEV